MDHDLLTGSPGPGRPDPAPDRRPARGRPGAAEADLAADLDLPPPLMPPSAGEARRAPGSCRVDRGDGGARRGTSCDSMRSPPSGGGLDELEPRRPRGPGTGSSDRPASLVPAEVATVLRGVLRGRPPDDDPGPGVEAPRHPALPGDRVLHRGPRLPGEGGQPAAGAVPPGRRLAPPLPGRRGADDTRPSGSTGGRTDPGRVVSWRPFAPRCPPRVVAADDRLDEPVVPVAAAR